MRTHVDNVRSPFMRSRLSLATVTTPAPPKWAACPTRPAVVPTLDAPALLPLPDLSMNVLPELSAASKLQKGAGFGVSAAGLGGGGEGGAPPPEPELPPVVTP